MTQSPASEPASSEQPGEFYLGRQPILNRSGALVAHELLFRRARAAAEAFVVDDVSATASVIEHIIELGIDSVIGLERGFINVDAQALMSDIVLFLPHKAVVLEILETVRATAPLIERIDVLRRAGYSFALDDVTSLSTDIMRLLPLVELVKVDIAGMPRDRLKEISACAKSHGKAALAEKVETPSEFNQCLALGFDYFQGYHFARPAVLTGRRLSPAHLVLIDLINMLNSDAENADIERTIKHDAPLSINLLRLANSPALGNGNRIMTVAQALFLLGRKQLQRWLQILLYAGVSTADGSQSPLLAIATTRGKLLELLSLRLCPGNQSQADTAFTIGIMSLMDTLLATPMHEILRQFPVSQPVKDALLEGHGMLGDLLALARSLELSEGTVPAIGAFLQQYGLGIDEMKRIQIAAYSWSAEVTRAT